jgi:hypothetical protein
MATAPSLIRQQSSFLRGSTIGRDVWWSSSVIGSRMTARSFIDACLRHVTATQPSCSLVVPYSAMCRCAVKALFAALPNMPQMPHESPRPAAASNFDPPVRAVSENTQTTRFAMPASIASAACWTSWPALEPPATSEPARRGLMPRFPPSVR